MVAFFCDDASSVGVALRAFAGELLEESEEKFFCGMDRRSCFFSDDAFLDFFCSLGRSCPLATLLGPLFRSLEFVCRYGSQATVLDK